MSPMSISNGFLLPLFLLLVSSSAYSPKLLVLGSPVREQRYNRPDFLGHHFKSYNGFYDIKNKHYWTSTASTGVHGYAMAGIWILGGLGFGIFMIVKNLNNPTSSPVTDHSDSYYFIPFLVVVLFTFLAIVAAGFVLAANHSSLRRTKKLKETLLGALRDARRSIRSVMKAMREVHQLLCPYDKMTCFQLNSTSHKLGNEMKIIQHVVHKNRRSIDLAIQTPFLITVGVVTFNLVSVVAALVLLLLHWRPGFVMIIFLCWILTAICWLLTGFHFFIYTFAEDTCSAFEEFEQSPEKNSLLSILPCVEPAYGNQVMVQIGFAIHSFITELNSQVAKFSRLVRVDEQSDDFLLRGFWKICDPFSHAPNYSYNPNKCPKDTIPIGEIPDVLARFTCYSGNNSTKTCKNGWKGILSQATFDMAWSYTHSIQDLLNVLPDLQNLLQCSFVKDAFSNIVSNQCTPLRTSIRLLWSSMISLSAFMVVLVLAWVAKAYLDRGRGFSRCSLIPT